MIGGKALTEAGAVIAASLVALPTLPQQTISMAVGLIGVWLARQVFVNRENRRLERRQPWRETMPITGVGALIALTIIYDQSFGISTSAFIGLGVGWSTVVILDLLGERALAVMRAAFGTQLPQNLKRIDSSGNDGKLLDADRDIPNDFGKLIDTIDKVAPHYTPPGDKPPQP